MLSKNTVILLSATLILTTSCVSRRVTTPIIVTPEHTHTEKTETITPDGAGYTVKKEVNVTR